MNKNQKKVTYPYFFTNREQNVNIHKFPYKKRIFVHWLTIEDNGDKNDQ